MSVATMSFVASASSWYRRNTVIRIRFLNDCSDHATLALHPVVVVRAFTRARKPERVVAVQPLVFPAWMYPLIGLDPPPIGMSSLTSIVIPPSASTICSNPSRLSITK